MKVSAVETTFNPCFAQRAQKLANDTARPIGDAALELIVSPPPPPAAPPVDRLEATAEVTPRFYAIA